MQTRLTLLAAVFALTGCATVLGSAHDPVLITTDPVGARIVVDAWAGGTTPHAIAASSKHPPRIALHFTGCGMYATTLSRSVDPRVWGNVVLGPLGLLTAAVDFMTGAAYRINERHVAVRCVNGRAVGAEQIVAGMTVAEVRNAWGEPEVIDRVADSASEQWVYGLGYRLHIADGRVVSVQATERPRPAVVSYVGPDDARQH